MNVEVEPVRPTAKPKKTWSEIIETDCETQQICKEDAMDRRKWRRLVKDLA